MSDKKEVPSVEVKDIITNPSTKKPTVAKGENPIEAIKRAQEVITGQMALLEGHIQKKLKELLDDVNALKSIPNLNYSINWGDPSFFPYLKDLGLSDSSNIPTATKRTPKTPKTAKATLSDEPTPKEKLVLEFIKANPKSGKEDIQKGVKQVGKSTVPQVITKLIQRGLVQNLTQRPSPAQYQAVK